MSQFENDIEKFNNIYKLPVAIKPSLIEVGNAVERLLNFKNILAEELDEIDDVIKQVADSANDGNDESKKILALTSLSDLLGDLQVYCASEMAKFGLPIDEILSIIMQSNFSKLGDDGKPIYDERGKVMKGSKYWKPEPKIQELLENLLKT